MIRSLISAVVVATTTAASAGEIIDVTFINPGNETQFWGEVSSTMRSAAKDLDINLEIIHTDRDRIRMVDAATELAARQDKPDYAIIVNELKQGPHLLAELEDAGIPTFELLNRMTEEQRMSYLEDGRTMEHVIGSITPNNEVAGYEMAWSLINAARDAGKGDDGISMLALLGDAATPAALQREAGMHRAIKEAGDVTLVRSFPVMWDQDTAYKRTVKLLSRISVDTIWSANDQISFGAQQAAREAGLTPGVDIFFVGLNWSAGGLEAVAARQMTLTHGGHFFAGAWSMVLLRDIHDGNLARGSNVEFPMSAVDGSNVEQFLTSFAGRNWDEIDFTQFSCGKDGPESYSFTSRSILGAAAAN
jgi:ABC-type sugar transport system substrate-binding protein